MFSFIIRQFDTFPPFLIDIHLTLRQFHHDVRRFEPGIIGEIGTDPERAADFVFAVFLDVYKRQNFFFAGVRIDESNVYA